MIAAGFGYINKVGERRAFAAQDLIFVEANVEHRFADVDGDFAAWCVFWGPFGGVGGDVISATLLPQGEKAREYRLFESGAKAFRRRPF